MLSRSKQTLTWPSPAAPTGPVFYCNGDADDHLRLTVLIARALGSDRTRAAVEAACSPRSSWIERRDALVSILRDVAAPNNSGYVGVLVDPDALPAGHPAGASTWDDASFARERSELLDVLLENVERGGWVVARPSASSWVSARLDHLGPLDEPGGFEARELAELPPIAARLVDRLLKRGELNELAVSRWIAQDEPLHAVVEKAIEQTSSAVRATLARLCVERRPLDINGSCGPLSWGSMHDAPDVVERSAVAELTDRGLVLPMDANRVWIPRVIREVSGAGGAGGTMIATHQALSRPPSRPPSRLGDAAADVIERHWHATAAGDLAVAVETARYYVNDLRELAKARSGQGRYADAAHVFRQVVDQDPSDSYAWEYLGFNLVRAHQQSLDPSLVDEIERAYLRAHELAASNPLFHGRLIAFQIEHRGAAGDRIDGLCAYYKTTHGVEAVEWFGWQAVMGLRRARRTREADDLMARWRINKPTRRRPRRFGAGPRGIVIGPEFDAPLVELESEFEDGV